MNLGVAGGCLPRGAPARCSRELASRGLEQLKDSREDPKSDED